MTAWTPPALRLRPRAEIRATTALKAMLDAERCWPHEILDEPAVLLDTTTEPLLFLTDPALVSAAVMRNDGTLPRSRLQQRFAGHGTGRENVVTDTGTRSQAHRRALAPLFRAQRLPGYFPFLKPTVEQALAPWYEAAETGRAVDASRACVHATFGVVWQILFGETGQPTPPAAAAAMADGLHAAGLSGRMTATAQAVHAATVASLALRPTRPLVPDTPYAQTLIEPLSLSAREIEDNLQFLLTSGHESTALTVTWALLMLAWQPEEQEAVAREVRAATGDQPLDLAALQRMPRLGQVLNETMRLYPAAILVNREATADIVLGDLPVRRGTQVAVCFYGMHRHRAWWDDPDAFRPARFDPANGPLRHPDVFLPFSAGHHSCLGGHLAWLEATLILATALRGLRVTPADDGVRPRANYTLRPDRPVMLHFTPRP